MSKTMVKYLNSQIEEVNKALDNIKIVRRYMETSEDIAKAMDTLGFTTGHTLTTVNYWQNNYLSRVEGHLKAQRRKHTNLLKRCTK